MSFPIDLKDQFEKQGYVILEGLLQAEAATIKAAFDSLLEDYKNKPPTEEFFPDVDFFHGGLTFLPDQPDRLQKIQSVSLYVPDIVMPVYRHARIRQALARLGGDEQEYDFFGTKFFPLFPGGTSVGWHQDNHYFGTLSSSIVSCAV